MATKIDTVTARALLKPRHPPYWQKLRSECHIGFRKITAASTGSWIARFRDGSGKYQLNSLGTLDGIPPSSRFDEATKQAFSWFGHRVAGGSAKSVTVKQACENYIAKLSADGKESSTKEVKGRFRRWVYSNLKLSNTPLDKVSKTEIGEWRAKLSSTPIILQDKSKTTSKLRSASSLNRDMAVFKAALNLAFRDGYVASNSAWAHKLVSIKNATKRRTCYLDHGQRKALITKCPADLAQFVKGLSLLPLRPGTLAAFDVKDYDHRLRELRVGKDKAGQDRCLTLPASTADFFQAQTNNKNPEEPLFTQLNGKRWNKDVWKKPLKTAAKAANLPDAVTAYALRHSTITDLIALHRLDTMTVAVLSGTSLSMIEKYYGHLLKGHAAKALEGLEL